MKSNRFGKANGRDEPLTTSSGIFKVITTSIFEDEARRLKKVYPQIGKDIAKLNEILNKDPVTGNDALGKSCYKVRMRISGKNRGKSYGARIIINVQVIDSEVYLLSIYDKSKKEGLFEGELDNLLKYRLSLKE
ncbi:hypothetical protein SAMN05428949_6173 [Chitinophaga sp. YR627]|uniref:hypothetical protein n=1 Tax=Chitinophaga sp. YR627 TaxID=1881041 RepID=UPI0008E533EB|nr:hypothetical protein [Chitinophaga sp. YR627]SFO68632.1 hypothetical protein SAMN05428949_6173 [Chitinophaga sp. YR627]